YTAGSERLYLRPSLTLDGLYARTDAWKEDGVGGLGLDYEATDYSTAVLTPAVEFGGRAELRPGLTLRSFISAGVPLGSNGDWDATAHLQGAAGADGIDVSLPQDEVALDLRAGVQLFRDGALDIRAEYGGYFGGEATSHAAALTLSYRF
ncbi:autotransporter outer membrane beta-barrel domain-containing protein, partial [Poseidonocella sp. HB161398]|uniref:autotransporter outer membrane beta-barrel domain-containing protein n=1 Tax=Poseidonocella sp. HB161398 TaxID=2320855 RepID=UPI001486D3DB